MMVIDELRSEARKAFLAGVKAADPAAALKASLAAHPVSVPEGGRVEIIAVGKAALSMVETALQCVPGETAALVVTNYENAEDLAGAEVIAAAHPVPDENGLRAGQAVIDRVTNAGKGDLVLALISGGASALLPAPVAGLTLADKVAVNEVLLASGLDITEMNLVRQSLSRLKGGGMRRLATPARVVSHVLSDVLGDDLRIIGSGPSIAPVGTPADARALLQSRGLLEALPEVARNALDREPPQHMEEPAEAYLIGSNRQSVEATASACMASISEPDLTGEVEDAAQRVVAEAIAAGPGARIAFGGETTVALTGSGKGGRNQELALRVVRAAQQNGLAGEWVFLSGGTDGRDGPTDAAGGLVDNQSTERLSAAGVDLDAVLADNASYDALKSVGDLLVTGATGTNVADLQFLLRGA